jgi:MinD superfamily P-loop ATPase
MNTQLSSHIIPVINRQLCSGCGRCARLCPTRAVEVRDGKATIVRPADCTFCDICESYCPDEAIGRPFQIAFAPQGAGGREL